MEPKIEYISEIIIEQNDSVCAAVPISFSWLFFFFFFVVVVLLADSERSFFQSNYVSEPIIDPSEIERPALRREPK